MQHRSRCWIKPPSRFLRVVICETCPEHLVDYQAKNMKRDDTNHADMTENDHGSTQPGAGVFSPLIRGAIRFAILTHETHQKQKRKGKDIPYITHPLAVGMILAHAGASDDIIAAGILHDTIEDSVEEHKVDHAVLASQFGNTVADAVQAVSEPNKDLPWIERKQAALEHIKDLELPALWVKSADVISNVSEILDDYAESGEAVFSRFNAPKALLLRHYGALAKALIERWKILQETGTCVLTKDLELLAAGIERLSANRSV